MSKERQSELTPTEAARVREALKKYVESLGYGGQTRAAASLGVEQQHISRMVRARNPEAAGIRVAKSLGKLLRGDELAYLDARASSTDSHVERDDRYPSRPAGMRAARELGYSERAIEIVRSISLKANEDPGAEWWLEQARIENDRERRGIVTGRPLEMSPEAQAAVDAGDTSLPGTFRPSRNKPPDAVPPPVKRGKR